MYILHNILYYFIVAPPPTIKVTPWATSFKIGDSIDLTCTVSTDNVNEDDVAVVEWRRNGVIINGTQTTISLIPTMESSFYNIYGTAVHTITGLDSSEEGEYICSSYIIINSSKYMLDSDIRNVSKSIIIEGKYHYV